MSEHGLSAALLQYADEQIEAAMEKGTELHDDLDKYRANAMRRKVWEDVKLRVSDLRQKYLNEEDEL